MVWGRRNNRDVGKKLKSIEELEYSGFQITVTSGEGVSLADNLGSKDRAPEAVDPA